MKPQASTSKTGADRELTRAEWLLRENLLRMSVIRSLPGWETQGMDNKQLLTKVFNYASGIDENELAALSYKTLKDQYAKLSAIKPCNKGDDIFAGCLLSASGGLLFATATALISGSGTVSLAVGCAVFAGLTGLSIKSGISEDRKRKKERLVTIEETKKLIEVAQAAKKTPALNL